MKKRLISLVLVLLLIISILPMSVMAATSSSGKVTADVLNVRSGPGTKYSIVAKLKLNDNVTIIAEQSGWYKVSESRWVSADWVKKITTSTVSAVSFNGKVTADVLNVRSGPGTNYSVVAKLKLNDKVTVSGSQSGWYIIGTNKWVSADWVTKDTTSTVSFNGKVTADVLNVRSGPGTNYSVVAKLKLNDKVTVSGSQSGWYIIGTNKWVSADWVVKDTTIASAHKHPLSMVFLTNRYYKKCCVCGHLEDAAGNPVTIGNKPYYYYFVDYTTVSGKATNLGSKYPELGKETASGFQFNYEVILDAAQLGLDLAGLIPVVGEVSDALNTGIYLVKKDYENAALSAISMVPVLGYIGTTGKVYKTANKSIKIIRKADKLNDYTGVAKYVKKFGKLPDNYVTKQFAQNAGWIQNKGNLANVFPGKSIGGDIFNNTPVKGKYLLPNSSGRIWREADINYTSGYRNTERILYSNDGLFYKTIDHFKTVTKMN